MQHASGGQQHSASQLGSPPRQQGAPGATCTISLKMTGVSPSVSDRLYKLGLPSPSSPQSAGRGSAVQIFMLSLPDVQRHSFCLIVGPPCPQQLRPISLFHLKKALSTNSELYVYKNHCKADGADGKCCNAPMENAKISPTWSNIIKHELDITRLMTPCCWRNPWSSGQQSCFFAWIHCNSAPCPSLHQGSQNTCVLGGCKHE